MPLKYDDSTLRAKIDQKTQDKLFSEASAALNALLNGSGEGSEWRGWLDLPRQKPEDLQAMQEIATEIQHSGDLLVCVGIGGSYLGAKAVISALFPKARNIRFAGHHLSPLELQDLLDELSGRGFYINVISKSGTTTEPGVVFRILKDLAVKKFGREASRRIIATTDSAKGALKTLADSEGYRTFVIPDDVGGRFSVLTPVGLLPILTAGANLKAILKGAKAGLQHSSKPNKDNIALRYAANRQHLYRSGKAIEIQANFEPRLHTIAEWWKQLYGESEGKNGKGIFPASVNLTTDLHSMGQWIQDGVRNIFETFLIIDNYHQDIQVPEDNGNLDKLNYLAGKKMSFVNRKAYEGTISAHADGGVPVSTFFLHKLDEENLFELFVIFEVAVAVSAYMQGVNPFDQPGVEAYKTNMFKRLGKPGA